MFQYLPPQKKICCASIVFISLIFTSFYTYVQEKQPKKVSILAFKNKKGRICNKIKNVLEDFMQTTIIRRTKEKYENESKNYLFLSHKFKIKNK